MICQLVSFQRTYNVGLIILQEKYAHSKRKQEIQIHSCCSCKKGGIFMNYLTSSKLLDDTFNTLSERVLINGEPQQEIITNAYLGVSEKRHISSLEPFKQGDYVNYDGQIYMVMEETATKRHNKYRATMTACNFAFIVRDFLGRELIGKDALGAPQYKNIYGDPYDVHAVLNKIERDFQSGFQINMIQMTYFIDIQDTEKNRATFKINEVFDIKGKGFTVAMHDLTNNGRLGILFLLQGKNPPY